MSTKKINRNSATPIHAQLASILIRDIEEKMYPAGEKFPSERAIAEKYGISRTSVRECIAKLLSDGILVRTVGRGTFVAALPVGRQPVTASARQIGLWISAGIFNFVQPGYNQILTAAGETCRERGYRLQFHATDEGTQSIDAIFDEDNLNGGLDGNLVVGGVSRRALARLGETGVPLLLVDLLIEGDNADSVQIDYPTGIRQAIEHLKALGHRSVGFIGFPESHKYEAFWQSLEECGLAYEPRHTRFFSASYPEPGALAGFNAMQKMIAGGCPPSAVVVTNDYAALGALEALAIAGLRVPEDISVVGCDDLQLTSRGLTTIHVDLAEVGRAAALALLDWIEKGVEPGRVIVPARLIVRDTTAPPRCPSLVGQVAGQN